MKCLKCGYENEESADFCANCGTNLKNSTLFCPNCGTNLPSDAEFCPNCGTDLKNLPVQPINETMIETVSKESKNIINKMKGMVTKYRKQIVIVFLCIFTIGIGIILYNNFIGFEKLSWNDQSADFNLKYIAPSKVELGINFSNELKINQLKVTTTCGTFKQDKLNILWDLSTANGKCKIEVKYKLHKIDKEYTIIDPNIEKKELSLDYKIDYDSDEDLDLDGLTNKQEKEYKTNPQLYDSDLDGLDDYYELFESKTDPMKEDSDNDGLNDYNEIEMGLDPLKPDSKGDGVKDGNRLLNYTIRNEKVGISLDITGKGNISSSIIDTFKNTTISKMPGLLDTVYNFYTSGKIDSATVKIPYSLEELSGKGLDEDHLTLYFFNEDTKELEAMPTTVDKENKTITVTLKHFSKYVIGDSSLVNITNKSQIMMVIDNSISMYTYNQLTELGYTNITGADGNDSTFKRLSLTNNLIDMFTGNYYFGISEFAGKYVKLQSFTDNKDKAKQAVNSIKNDVDSVGSGTKIVNALTEGIEEFKDDEYNHYLILLTDGKDTSYSMSYSKDKIISQAKEDNVKICVIGLGNDIDTDDLSEIAKETGCAYYNANDSKSLDEIYALIGADINYNLVDVDGDGQVDGTVIADSGFIVTRDGFSFDNYGTNLSPGGHCYGMATFAELYYVKKLPIKAGKLVAKDSSSYAYDLKNTYFANYANLYDYKLKTNVLKYTFGYEIFGEEMPKDILELDNDTLSYNSQIKEELNNSEIYDILVKESTINKKEQIKKYGYNYKNIEKILLNEDKMQSSKVINNNDKQLLNAIYASFIKQDVTNSYASSSNWILWLRNVIGTESTEKLNSAAFIELLKSRLENGDAPVITSSFSDGLHAINAISLIQDNKDSNHYYIGVYDNNYPGEKRYVDLKCNKNSCVTKKNKYYTSSNEPVRISMSLEDDLKFFEQ